jgi:hypothetical protein
LTGCRGCGIGLEMDVDVVNGKCDFYIFVPWHLIIFTAGFTGKEGKTSLNEYTLRSLGLTWRSVWVVCMCKIPFITLSCLCCWPLLFQLAIIRPFMLLSF